MSYEIIGRLIAKFNVIQRSETFKTREFVIEKSEEINGRMITNYIKFQAVQDRTGLVDRFQEGDMVKVSFNLKGSKWEKEGKINYITNLDAWRMEAAVEAKGGNSPSMDKMPVEPAFQEKFNPSPEIADDLPF
ncbi:MAG: DUF3127 domain-containing protein [Chitinophagaceae bacterium]